MFSQEINSLKDILYIGGQRTAVEYSERLSIEELSRTKQLHQRVSQDMLVSDQPLASFQARVLEYQIRPENSRTIGCIKQTERPDRTVRLARSHRHL